MDVQDQRGNSALVYAAANGHVEVVRLLLDAGANANLKDINGCTALFHAADENDTQIIYDLLAAGADFNAQSKNGETPLMLAVGSQWWHCPSTGHRRRNQTVPILLGEGADPNITNSTGLSPLVFAARLGKVIPVRELIHAGADVFFRSANGVHYIPKTSRTAREYGKFLDNPSPERISPLISQHPGNYVDVVEDFTALEKYSVR